MKMSSPTPSPTRRTLPSPPPSRGRDKASLFSQRVAKPNPLLGKSISEKAEARRKGFLKRVREGVGERRWEGRGGDEEVMRVLWEGEERERRVRERVRVLAEGCVEGEEESLGMCSVVW